MSVYVAFLRGMNLGKRRIRNGELVACFEAMGFDNVSAFLASGNVIFASKKRVVSKLATRIQEGLARKLGYEVPTFLRTGEDVARIGAHQPFSAALMASAGKLQVALLSAAPTAAQTTSAVALSTSEDRLVLKAQELYWLPKGNMSDSQLDMKALATTLGPMTIRTQRTLSRLAARIL